MHPAGRRSADQGRGGPGLAGAWGNRAARKDARTGWFDAAAGDPHGSRVSRSGLDPQGGSAAQEEQAFTARDGAVIAAASEAPTPHQASNPSRSLKADQKKQRREPLPLGKGLPPPEQRALEARGAIWGRRRTAGATRRGAAGWGQLDNQSEREVEHRQARPSLHPPHPPISPSLPPARLYPSNVTPWAPRDGRRTTQGSTARRSSGWRAGSAQTRT